MLIHRFRSVALLCAALVALQGCAGSPVSIAQTPEQKYAAVKVTYDAVLAGAEAFIADTSAPQTIRAQVRDAAVASGPIYRQADAAYREFVAAKVAIGSAPPTPGGRLQVAASNLEHWLAELDRAATSLKALAHR